MGPVKQNLDKHNGKFIIITGGDPTGVAPELMIHLIDDIAAAPFPVVYYATTTDATLLDFKERCESRHLSPVLISQSEIMCESNLSDSTENIFIIKPAKHFTGHDIIPGRPGKKSGMMAFEALKNASDFIENYGCLGLLTAPVSKEWITRSGKKEFKGHTNYLASRFNSFVLMLMHGLTFSVIPLTVHIPLTRVSKELKKVISDKNLYTILKKILDMPPFQKRLWAFCGLNPHAGEGGYLGREEESFINGKVSELRAHGFPIHGPLPADSIFMADNLKNFRLIFGCYHDQVLIPFKSIEGYRGINCTIGLPFLRSSPDHGTAFDIAGKNICNPESMKRAFQFLVENNSLN